MKDKDIYDELDELSPFLSGHKKSRQKGQPALPADYFAGFESRLMDKIDEATLNVESLPDAATTKKRWTTSALVLLKPKYLSLAAACMLGVIIGWQYISSNSTEGPMETTTGLLAELSIGETQYYLLEHVEDLELAELAGLIEDAELDEIQKENILTDKYGNDAIIEDSKATKEGGKKILDSKESSMKKAIDKTKTEDLLDDLTEDDLDSYELF